MLMIDFVTLKKMLLVKNKQQWIEQFVYCTLDFNLETFKKFLN